MMVFHLEGNVDSFLMHLLFILLGGRGHEFGWWGGVAVGIAWDKYLQCICKWYAQQPKMHL